MFLSKIQVKNVIEKNLGKYQISRLLKGTICYDLTSGYKLTEKENGFIGVAYIISNPRIRTREEDTQKREIKLSQVHNLFLSLGFEFDGIDGYRKERELAK
jgi:hypothetical protein